MRLFCNHQWAVLSNTKIDSPVERLCKADSSVTVEKVASILMLQTYIQIFHCKTCGKLKRYVEKV